MFKERKFKMFGPTYIYKLSDGNKVKSVEYSEVTHWYCDKEFVSIINDAGKEALLPFGGEISFDNALRLENSKQGYFTIFCGAKSYRKSEDANEEWQHFSDDSLLSCFVHNGVCMAVIKGSVPHVLNEADSKYFMMINLLSYLSKNFENKATIVSLDDYRKKRGY